MTTTATTAALGRIIGAQEDAKRAAEAAYQAKNDARSALYAAESAERDASEAAKAAAHDVDALARALAHAGEPYTAAAPDYPRDSKATEYRSTFGWAMVAVRTSSGRWSSKAQPQVATAYGRTHTDSAGVDLYRSERGTSDAGKLAAELERAHEAARAFIAGQTADAWLRAHDLDELAGDPAAARRALDDLVTVTLELRRDYFQERQYLSPRWSVALGGIELRQPLNSWDVWPLAEDRDAIDHGQPEAPAEPTPETWRAYEAAQRAYWNRPDVRGRALAAAGLTS